LSLYRKKKLVKKSNRNSERFCPGGIIAYPAIKKQAELTLKKCTLKP
jgi:hypothetical protein